MWVAYLVGEAVASLWPAPPLAVVQCHWRHVPQAGGGPQGPKAQPSATGTVPGFCWRPNGLAWNPRGRHTGWDLPCVLGGDPHRADSSSGLPATAKGAKSMKFRTQEEAAESSGAEASEGAVAVEEQPAEASTTSAVPPRRNFSPKHVPPDLSGVLVGG